MPSKATTDRKIKTLQDYKNLASDKNGKFDGFITPKAIRDKTDRWYCYTCKDYVEMSFVNLRKSKQFSCCSPSKKKTLQDYIDVAKKRGGTYTLSYIPENSHEPIEGWCCEKDHDKYIWKTCYNSIMNGHWCAICAKNKAKTLEEYKQFAESKNWKYILDYIPSTINISIKGWECQQKHLVDISYKSIYIGTGCTYCYGNAKKELKDYLEIGTDLNFNYILDYIPENTDTHIEGWQCANKHLINTSYSNVRDKKVACGNCPKPAQSSYEIRIERLLDTHEMKYETQVAILNFPKYKYDFIIYKDGQKILCELDGRQHFQFISFFHSDQEYYEKRRNDDIQKTINAKNAGYKLIRLDYNYLDTIDDQNLMQFIKVAFDSDEQFITTNKVMYQWIYDTVYLIKPKLKLIN